jgi:hypothetical protein
LFSAAYLGKSKGFENLIIIESADYDTCFLESRRYSVVSVIEPQFAAIYRAARWSPSLAAQMCARLSSSMDYNRLVTGVNRL